MRLPLTESGVNLGKTRSSLNINSLFRILERGLVMELREAIRAEFHPKYLIN